MAYLDAAKQTEILNQIGGAALRRHMRETILPALATALGEQVAHIPTAGEVSGNTFDIDLTFDPISVIVQVRTTATGALVAWDGDAILTTGASPKVTINNDGAVDWSVNETVYIMVTG